MNQEPGKTLSVSGPEAHKSGVGMKAALIVLSLIALAGWVCMAKQASRAKEISEQAKAEMSAMQSALQGELSRLKETLASREQELSDARQNAEEAAAKTEEMEALRKQEQELSERLKKEIQEGKAQIEMVQGMLRVTCIDMVTFATGSDEITSEGRTILDKIAETLRTNASHIISVEGHADSMKIGPVLRARFATNWELSTARALAVLHYFESQHGIDPKRLVAAGYGEHQPKMSNETEEGMRQNRRVEILLTPKRALR